MFASISFLIVQTKKVSSVGAFMAGILAGLAMSIKISGIFIILPLALVFLLKKRKKLLVSCILGWLFIAGGLWIYYLSQYGHLAFYQLILLHFIKGETLSFFENFRTVFIPSLNYLLVFGTGGLLIGLFKTKNSLKISLAVFCDWTYRIFFNC